ncbi:MFS superfamily (SUL1) (PDB:3NY7) [Commensalibacter communis]|uniref:MFS superfamily (SUL1) n=1 Tax=Commensalibacter communis TaxID=2972786 RepID=A0A9W4XCZ9_9PROT|nr:SulP family inorganic anion transporter [Commensalibacter communis]CAI3937425.1 MFS superfamily (SUL1) (PDB:3NY7) [Commensalibacter communis]CAI3942896.1 MFS superfamily (SUL1) (PDB:3NY7) [Commensalibacter communis]CAI3943770.1 MFS superfamily (SUL1) (PDB:3NY7) [Commensalibacter communis]CAI3943859.1 MFS superfamily (SUL1) (PDB:3NY7) [Commensalibacter communis]CAI3946004.1 MFS superfamily (SUL1) (PDB:3NY7) [Commensalibacter communis]
MLLSSTRQDWLGNIRADVLAGIVVALALIPESIAFSIFAGVDPSVGLYSAFCIPVVLAFVGGRPAMVSSSTGSMALLMGGLVHSHGLNYLLVAGMLAGVFQIIAGYLKLGNLMRFVSHSVVTGFVNALAILIFMAQMREITGGGWQVYALTLGGLAIVYLFPYVTKAIPSPLICILIITAIAIGLGWHVPTVGSKGHLPDGLPALLIPNVPLNLETLWIILPYSFGLAAVGLLETMMTATIVDEFTETGSDKNRECKGQGIANIVTSFFGGMAGCAMIGQSVINIKSGGRGRLSTMVAGIFLLILVVFLKDWVARIPMAALVAIMIMVSISTFSWKSILDLRTHPLSTSFIMILTVVIVVATGNLAYGVFAGVLVASLTFANKVSHFMMVKSELSGTTRTYYVNGQLFFASSKRFIDSFDYQEHIEKVVIDVSHAHLWDISSVDALDKVVIQYRKVGVAVEVKGMNEASATIVDRFGIHDKPEDVNTVTEKN